MPRLHRRDTPEYALNIIEGAQPIGLQLATAAGLLTMLMAAMSAVPAPLPHQLDGAADTTGAIERHIAGDTGFLCSLNGKMLRWIDVEAS